MQVSSAARAFRSPIWVTVLVACLALSPLVSCGGKKRPPPLPPNSRKVERRARKTQKPKPRQKQQSKSQPKRQSKGQPQGQPKEQPRGQPKPLSPIGEAPVVRLLLKESFHAVTVRGSGLAPLVVARVTERKITLRRGADVDGEVLGAGSGFRLAPAGAEPLLLDGVPYRGVIEVFINPLGTAVAVNEVDLEDYLRGAVPNELHPSRFPEMEALKAQAVAARTFAVYHLGTFVKRGFDLYSDERSQVYSGIRGEHPVADQAIGQTRGVIATYQGQAILSVYSSTCGGMTESYAATFQRDLPYLKGGVKCSDDISPFHSWETTLTGAKMESTLNRRAQFGRLKDIKAVRRGVSGRVIEMRLSGSKASRTLVGNDVRYVLGLKSSLIDDMRIRKDDDGGVKEVVFKGRGWGHGVGLCQYGAVAMARHGASYEKILKYYYNDIELTRTH